MLKIPSYIKFFIILFGLIMIFYVMIVGRAIFVPLITAFIFALILQPLSSRLEKWKFPRGLSSIVSIIAIFAVLFFTFYYISYQVRSISRDLSEIGEKFEGFVDRGHDWMEENFGVEESEQTAYLKNSINDFVTSSTSILTSTLSATAGFFTAFVLIFISLFFLLYYRSFFVEFLYRAISDKHHQKLTDSIYRVSSVVRAYVLGLFTVILILAVLNTTGLMLLGIEHAMFFGALAAMLTIIPYIGIFIGSLLPILFALLTKDSLWYPLGVAILFWGIQFLEGNFITPNIVGNKVSLNPFAVIVALFLGGMVWGAIGMILAIPIVAALKVIFDVVDPLKPYGFLLGYPKDDNETNENTKVEKRLTKVKEKV
ncbi:AI-2E family transporter [Catalinimonas niigatensis]|uniref:AI-2E family transporter n=1 Tax=Catalinimonas niigatensis TaxID=1397264 RepID=UPI0026657CE9|nr:AI-2E family transporter [Catalinimonas niigatensis]WPP50648.1 AI-2E family transporter [Catalinimonas niigatensis]